MGSPSYASCTRTRPAASPNYGTAARLSSRRRGMFHCPPRQHPPPTTHSRQPCFLTASLGKRGHFAPFAEAHQGTAPSGRPRSKVPRLSAPSSASPTAAATISHACWDTCNRDPRVKGSSAAITPTTHITSALSDEVLRRWEPRAKVPHLRARSSASPTSAISISQACWGICNRRLRAKLAPQGKAPHGKARSSW